MRTRIVFVLSLGIFLLACLFLITTMPSSDEGKIVLPGGTTYLGK